MRLLLSVLGSSTHPLVAFDDVVRKLLDTIRAEGEIGSKRCCHRVMLRRTRMMG